MKNRLLVPILIFLFTTVVFLPIILNPNIFLNRGNDLTEFFWPIYYFTKEHLIQNRTLPFWNNLFLSGTPLLPDPQAPLFYLPNIIFLLLPIGTAFAVSAFLHTFFGGIFTYLAAFRGFKLTKSASLVAAFLYVSSPRLAGYLEAGHFGLISTYAWLPLAILAILLLSKKPSIYGSILLAISLAGLFYTHTTTFVIASFVAPIFLLTTARKDKLKFIKLFGLGVLLTFGLVAITLLPQLSWVPNTNRYLLINDKQIYPVWLSKKEFIEAVFFPWIDGISSMQNIDTEKWLFLGIFPSLLSFVGFTKLNKKAKLVVVLLAAAIIFIALSNSSPFYSFLLTQNWFVFTRVATRVWFIMVILVTFLAAYGFQIIFQKQKGLAILVATLAVLEIFGASFIKVTEPVIQNNSLAPKEVYEFLRSDPDRFRVFCTTRCLSQKTAAEYGLELVDGYSTLIQKNYNSHAWQMMGTYWNYYTLTIPPIGAYVNHEVHPEAVSLGEYNTKYVISPYKLNDKNFVEVKKISDYLIYSNKAYKPRSPAPITYYSPNRISVDTSNYKEKSLVMSEVYSPGWNAYLDGTRLTVVQETPEARRAVDITPDTTFVDFRYEPPNFSIGKAITIVSIVGIIVTIILKVCGFLSWK